jgi:hypothetical protein
MKSHIAIAAAGSSPVCLSCTWWTRSKQAKKGSCTKSLGRMIYNTALETTRYAYPATVSTDSCDEYKGA